MTRIIFVRHGQTEWNLKGKYQGQTDVPLSKEGIAQAHKLAENFPTKRLDAIYSSDLSRAMETARIAAGKFGLEVQEEPAFREVNFGEWEGLSYEEIATRWPKVAGDFFRRPDALSIPGGETFQVLQERAIKRISGIVDASEGQTVAVFAHGAILRTVLCHALHMPLAYLWAIRQSNTAVSIVAYEDGWSSVELMNSTAHLSM